LNCCKRKARNKVLVRKIPKKREGGELGKVIPRNVSEPRHGGDEWIET